MNYYSLNRKSPNVDFKTAVIKGIAPDRGLYFPERITPLDPDFFKNISDTSNVDIAFESIKLFVEGEIPDHKLYEIVEDTLCFNFPLVKLNDDIFSLELYHGPTMAFKDVGARFMARCLGYFNKEGNNVTVLVATSGDTGGAVASGFYKVPGVNVVILYPKGKVSELQEEFAKAQTPDVAALQEQLDAEKSASAALRSKVSELQAEIERAKEGAGRTPEQQTPGMAALQAQLAAVREEKNGLSAELQAKKAELDAKIVELAALKEDKESLQTALDGSKQDGDALQREKEEWSAERDSLKAQKEEEQSKVQELR